MALLGARGPELTRDAMRLVSPQPCGAVKGLCLIQTERDLLEAEGCRRCQALSPMSHVDGPLQHPVLGLCASHDHSHLCDLQSLLSPARLQEIFSDMS